MKTRSKNKTGRKPSAKKQQTKKIIITSVAIGAAGILGYFGWQYFKKKKEAKKTSDLDTILQSGSGITTGGKTQSVPTYTPSYIPPVKPSMKNNNTTSSTYTSASSTSSTGKAGFPLKRGSKSENVRLLQQALITKYGKTILPRYGADGDFGSETITALKKAGLPETINESTFNVLTQGSKPDSTAIGKELYNAAAAKNYSKVLTLLKQLQSVDDYTKANEVFKQYRLGSVRQTIVNGLLNIFSSTTQKETIRLEFLRIGLQYDGSKWSLSGFDGQPVMTIEPTTVWISAAEGVKVPARMVLGNEVSKRLDYTLFENNGKYFLVYTKAIQYLK